MSRKTFSANFAYNVLGPLLPLLTSLGTVPFYIHQIGLARYGVVTITWILLGYFGFLDFGLSRASANALSKLGVASSHERAPVLATAFCCNLVLGLIGGWILYVVGHIALSHLMKIPSSLSIETQDAYPWMVAMLPLGMLSGVATGALESHERFLLSNLLGSAGTMGGQIIPLICAYTIGPSLDVVIPATLLTRLVTVLLSYAIVIKLEWPISLFNLSFTWMRKLFSYGSWVTVSSLLNPLLNTSNQLIIGATLGASSVAIYSVPMALALRSQIVATALARTLFPRSSRCTPQEAIDITRRATLSLIYGFGMACGPAILLCGPFLRLWIDNHFAVASQGVAQILIFGAWINGIAFLPYGFIQARGLPHITAMVGLIEVLPYFAVLWFLIYHMGLVGAAIAWTLRVTINCIALFVLSKCFPPNLWRVLPAILLMVGSLMIARLTPMSAITAVASAIAIGLTFAILTLGLDPMVRETGINLGRHFGILRQPALLQRDPL